MQQVPEILDFSNLSQEAISKLLQTYQLNLTVDEALTIQHRFLNRPPTFAECVLWSIQGSEHCSYKSSRKHLKQFVTQGPHVILGPKEDAGIVAVASDFSGVRYGIVASHESHNHPSQIVPYEGAATGVGGNVRDVCCMGAEVIAIADSLRFGDIDRPKTHWIYEGVASGIAGYGNPLGIPNLAGDVYYDAAYNDNCLVTVVTLGVVREDEVIHSYAPIGAQDYVFILVGKPTDDSGFLGASFASQGLEETQIAKNKGAVQEPNAFLQRHLLKANYALFKWLKEHRLLDKVGFKDLGAGGIACASVELAEAGGYGAHIDLARIPTSMPHLKPFVLLCSETQERFMWVVPPSLVDTILTHYNETYALPQVSSGACAAVIGSIRTDGEYVVTLNGLELVHAKARDITQGLNLDRPFIIKEADLDCCSGHSMFEGSLLKTCRDGLRDHGTLMAGGPFLKTWNGRSSSRGQETSIETIKISEPEDYHQVLLAILSHENVASRAPLYETYDKQVQGRTVLEAGWADAGVMQPFNEDKYPEEIREIGIALSLDHNPRYNKISAYWGAVNAVIEAVRNVAAVGATPLALTDCLCFGNPEKPEEMGEFVASVRGIADAAFAIKLKDHPEESLPIISGNVSFYNESQQRSIPPSPIISCLGSLPEVNKALTFDLKRVGSILVLVGERKDECGGSIYFQLNNVLGSKIPKPDLSTISQEIHAVAISIQQGLLLSAHDISEGGVALALAEMSFKSEIGVKVNIPGSLATDVKLFSETGGFLLEVAREHMKALNGIFTRFNTPITIIGETIARPRLQMNEVIDLSVSDAKNAWEVGLREKLVNISR